MIGNSFLIQLLMLGLAMAVFFTHVKPTFLNIGKIQDEIASYKEELGKVSEVNQKLQTLNDQMLAISATDRQALETYMPDKVDEVKVVSDLFSIANEARVYAKSVKYNGNEKSSGRRGEVVEEGKDDTPVEHSIAVGVSGTYEQCKRFLALLEVNNYPLEVHDLTISTSDIGILDMEMELVTYSHK